MAVLLAPRGFPGRWLGVAWLAPLVLIPAPRIAPGALEVSALDVGQGLSVVVRTRDHVMVYDTGPGFPSGFNAGSAVLAPFLATLGIRRIDALVISHQHHDHTGGVGGLRERVGVDRLIANQSNDFGPAQPCVRGLAWRWDGVDFKVLHPEAGSLGDGNEGSCVVQVRGRGGSVLLPGDIERRGERSLVAQYGAALSSDILVAPHHGSATSSSPPLLAAVRPRWAILSRGYRNRFGFPHRAVVARYRRYAIPLLDTAALGAVQFILHADGRVTGPVSHRRSVRRYWHRELESPEVRKKSPEVRKKSPKVRKKSVRSP